MWGGKCFPAPQGVASTLRCAVCFWINSGVLRALLPDDIGPDLWR